jgi:hypothetical protein
MVFTTPSQKYAPPPSPVPHNRPSFAAASEAQAPPLTTESAYRACIARTPKSSVTSDSHSFHPNNILTPSLHLAGEPPAPLGDRHWIESQSNQIQNQTLGE